MNEDDTNETNDERRRRAITGRTDGRNHRKFAYVDLTAPKVAAGKNLVMRQKTFSKLT